jgi:hypothetical protein
MIPVASPTQAHVADRIGHPLTEREAADLRGTIAVRHGIGVEPVTDVRGHVQLWCDRPLSTRARVRVLAEVLAVTDAPIEVHAPAGPPLDIVWTAT